MVEVRKITWGCKDASRQRVKGINKVEVNNWHTPPSLIFTVYQSSLDSRSTFSPNLHHLFVFSSSIKISINSGELQPLCPQNAKQWPTQAATSRSRLQPATRRPRRPPRNPLLPPANHLSKLKCRHSSTQTRTP